MSYSKTLWLKTALWWYHMNDTGRGFMQGSAEQFFRFSSHWRRLFSGAQLVDGLDLKVHHGFIHMLGVLVRWLGQWAQRGPSTTAPHVASVVWLSPGSETRQLDSPRGSVPREPGDTAWPFWSSRTSLVQVSWFHIHLSHWWQASSKFSPDSRRRKLDPGWGSWERICGHFLEAWQANMEGHCQEYKRG